jgi:tetratricopeptide (TPR) repeat protein
VAVALAVLLCSLGVVGKAWWETNRAYAAYQKEQRDKEERTRQAVPAFVKVARLAVNQREFDEALSEVSLALDYDPDYLDARLLRGQLLVARHDFAAARRELETYLAKKPPPDKKGSLAELWEKKSQDQAISGLVELCQRKNPDEPTTLVALSHLLEQQKAPVLADALLVRYGRNAPEARQAVLEANHKRIEAAWPGAGGSLSMDDAGVVTLNLGDRKDVARLDALAGMPIDRLTISKCSGVADLSPLRGMRLTELNADETAVRDLSPLAGMPLTKLSLSSCRAVRDLSPLRGMPLTDLNIYDAAVQDLSPLRGMPLKRLHANYCPVTDFSPLRGLPLAVLAITSDQAHDFSWLAGMKLEDLAMEAKHFSDLSPLAGMPLKRLDVLHTAVADLSPLKGAPLEFLKVSECGKLTDLSPLAGMPLAEICLPPQVTKGMDALRRMKSLKNINHQPADEFWKKYDAEQAKK